MREIGDGMHWPLHARCIRRLPKIAVPVIGSTTLDGTLRLSSSKFARLANSRFWQKGGLRGRFFFWAFLAAIGSPIVDEETVVVGESPG